MTNAPLISEDELHAYVDGHLAPERRKAVDLYLAEHPDDAIRVRDWQLQREGLRSLFNPVLAEPIPATMRVERRFGFNATAQAAGILVAILLGGILGWTIRGGDSAPTLPELPRQAALAHVVYSPEIIHPVEVSAREEAHLVSWLSKRLGATVRAPDLAQSGFELMGGRLLPGETGPAAQLMYQNARGSRLTLYVRHADRDSGETAFRYAQEGNISVFYWVDGPFGYALSGEINRQDLLKNAERVYRAFNP